jgi:hypothetical protein
MKNDSKAGASAPVNSKAEAKPAPATAKAGKSTKVETPAPTKAADKSVPVSQPAPTASRQGATGASAAQPKAAPSAPAAIKREPAPAALAKTEPAKTPAAKPEPAAAKTAPRSPASPAPKKAEAEKQSLPTPQPSANVASEAPAKPEPARPTLADRDATTRRGSPSKPEAAAATPLAAVAGIGAETTRTAYAQVQQSSEALRQAMTGNTAAMTSGFAEINGKVLDLVRAQAEAALDVWRSTLTATSPAEAVQAQARAIRKAYEDTTQRWKDLFETTTRVAGAAFKPPQSARDKDSKR